MSRSRTILALSSAAALCAVLASAGRARAGAEKITLGLQQYTIYVNTQSDVVPVNIKLANGSPDYIDTTYSAQDSDGNPVTCSPASNRFYMTRNTSTITDNVVVNADPNVPVLFTATAQGEAPGGDFETSSQYLG